ncbi:MAG: hypothetical protein AB7P20_14785 [Rhizobiaceae bacterium]
MPPGSDGPFLKGLTPHVEALLDEGYGQFSKASADKTYSDSLNTGAETLTEVIRSTLTDGETSPDGTDYDGVWNGVVRIREEALKRGVRAEDIDAYLVEIIITNAERTDNDDLLGLLDRTIPGDAHPLSHRLDIQKKRDAAADNISMAKAREEVDNAKAREEADKKLANEAYADIATRWSKDINEDIPEETIKALSRVDPMARSKLADLRNKLNEADGLEDKATIARVFADIHEGRADTWDWIAPHGVDGFVQQVSPVCRVFGGNQGKEEPGL